MHNPTAASHGDEWKLVQQLFLAYLSGDTSVINELFLSLGRNVKGFFLVRTRSETDSDDLTQATLLKIHLSRQSYDSRLSLKTWVFTIAHRTLIDHWRKRSRVDAFEASDNSDNLADYADTSASVELSSLIALRAVLEKALDTLKPLDRSIVYLGVVEGLSMAELAVVMHSTEGAIKVRLHRLLKSLRGILNDADAQEVKP